jgi:hypothetical protein
VESLFNLDGSPEGDAFLRRVEALVAPVAAHAGVVVDDPGALEIARAVFAAFGSPDATGGLTRAQIQAACSEVCDAAQFDSRFELFCRLDMLEPFYEKAHQQRYVFNPTSAAGIMVFDRLAANGGVDELVTLLDRTRADMESGRVTREQVRDRLRQALRMMAISADHLLRMVSSSPISELIAQRRHHDHRSLMPNVFELSTQVKDRFPDLDPDAYALVVATQRYVGARDDFVVRLLAEGAAAKDFSMLEPEEYLEAARTASMAELAAVFDQVVFDPPSPNLDPDTVAEKVIGFVPKPRLRRRPPRPPESEEGPDPMASVEARAVEAKRRRARAADLHLQGEDEVDLSSRMRAAGWPGAAKVLVEAMAIDADPDLPVQMRMSSELLVDPDAGVTHLSPVLLRRVAPTEQVLAAALADLDADLDDLGFEAARAGDLGGER